MRKFGMDVQYTNQFYNLTMFSHNGYYTHLIMRGEIKALSLGRTTNSDLLVWF